MSKNAVWAGSSLKSEWQQQMRGRKGAKAEQNLVNYQYKWHFGAYKYAPMMAVLHFFMHKNANKTLIQKYIIKREGGIVQYIAQIIRLN